MIRVDAIQVAFPPFISIEKIGSDLEAGPYVLGALGHLENFRKVDRHTLQFDFVALSEAGEILAKRIRAGYARFESAFPDLTIEHQRTAKFMLRIKWDSSWHGAPEDQRIIAPFL